MTGDRRAKRSTTPHLQRRNGMFHLRVRVPDVIRRKLGMCEVNRSLKTYDRARARLLAAVLVPQVQEVFRMAMTTTMDREQLRSMLQSHFRDLAREVDGGFLPTGDRPDLQIVEQREMSLERIGSLKSQVSLSTYDNTVRWEAARLIGSEPAYLAKLPADASADLCQGVARAEIEQLKLYLHRLTDRLGEYIPSDPLFATRAAGVSPYQVPLGVSPVGPSLKTVVEHHLEAGRNKWTAIRNGDTTVSPFSGLKHHNQRLREWKAEREQIARNKAEQERMIGDLAR